MLNFALLRVASFCCALFFGWEIFEEGFHQDSPLLALTFGLKRALSRRTLDGPPRDAAKSLRDFQGYSTLEPAVRVPE
jgi:hypothetical protein